ncbi:anti sigma factor C-terminal domain-containing protein [Peribacillus simplex]|uniref:anti sigma factor C-terminal domain-containing protein n=1 Tax=Peribacillus simplex TaxID=1478 RepID=UPI0025A1663D|nr:anti sigma factor C-terminal domain-containing protein [Peribacillus simplex]MDM5291866.1 anti sigma factor C-terminal domain-containing protein [Peribacillus simplex]
MSKKNTEKSPDFLLDDKEFQKSMRKTRRKSIIKNVLITSFILILGSTFLYIGSNKIIAKRIHALDVAESRWIYLTEPNVQQNGTDYTYSLFSADGKSYFTKRFGDRKIPWYTENSHFTVSNTEVSVERTMEEYSEEENQWLVFNNEIGQRELQFYHPSVDYKKLPNALSLLNKLDPISYYEYAISFDKAYSINEIKEMLDKKEIEWLWIDTQTKNEIQTKNEQDKNNELSSFQVGSIFGFPYNSTTNWSNLDFFLKNLSHPEIQSSPYASRATEIEKRLKRENPKLNPDKVKIIGAVVTGTPDELMKYKNKDFIRASSLGASTKKY